MVRQLPALALQIVPGRPQPEPQCPRPSDRVHRFPRVGRRAPRAARRSSPPDRATTAPPQGDGGRRCQARRCIGHHPHRIGPGTGPLVGADEPGDAPEADGGCAQLDGGAAAEHAHDLEVKRVNDFGAHVWRGRGDTRGAGACSARERSCIPEPIRLACDHRGPDRDGEGKVPQPSAAPHPFAAFA